MANTFKVLAQVTPGAASDTTLGTVPSAKGWVVSTLTICNTGTTLALVRVAVRIAGATLTTAQYVVYDEPVAPKSTLGLTLGITLATTDVVTVRSDVTNVAFNLFGQEVDQ